jgi:hypothetical protein
VTERFTLDAAASALRRSYVAEDPVYLQKPFAGADTVYTADVAYQPVPCDDQSYKSDAGAGDYSRWVFVAVGFAGAMLVAGWTAWRFRRRARPALP